MKLAAISFLVMGMALCAVNSAHAAIDTIPVFAAPSQPLDIVPECLGADAYGSCARLQAAAHDLLLNPYGMCHWIDNTTANDYFLPYRSPEEWQAFVDGHPAEIVVDACCPAAAHQAATLKDGTIVNAVLPIGRSHGNGSDGATSLGAGIKYYRVMKGSTLYREKVTVRATCSGGAWHVSAQVDDIDHVDNANQQGARDLQPLSPEALQEMVVIYGAGMNSANTKLIPMNYAKILQ